MALPSGHPDRPCPLLASAELLDDYAVHGTLQNCASACLPPIRAEHYVNLLWDSQTRQQRHGLVFINGEAQHNTATIQKYSIQKYSNHSTRLHSHCQATAGACGHCMKLSPGAWCIMKKSRQLNPARIQTQHRVVAILNDTAQHRTAQPRGEHSKCSTAQHSTAQHSTAQHSTAQHSTAQHSTAQQPSPAQDSTVSE